MSADFWCGVAVGGAAMFALTIAGLTAAVCWIGLQWARAFTGAG